ncbi:MAG: hypothetical protein K1X56_02055 [Flavobacteriales bacterium]|nr:hypothetical protein [Flavobacteriales bacterium]
MEFFKYIFHLGIIFIVFSLIWGFFMMIYRLLTGLSERPSWESYIFKTLNTYFLVSLAAMLTVATTKLPDAPRILISIVGMTIVYSYLAGRMQRTRVMVRLNSMKMINEPFNAQWETSLIFLSVIYFSFGITYPQLLDTAVNKWFLSSIYDIYNTIIIGWIIAAIGLFLVVINLVRSITITAQAVAWVLEKLNGGGNNNNNDNNNDGYTDYEEIN